MKGAYGRVLIALDRAEKRIEQAEEILGGRVVGFPEEPSHRQFDLLGDARRSLQAARRHLDMALAEAAGSCPCGSGKTFERCHGA